MCMCSQGCGHANILSTLMSVSVCARVCAHASAVFACTYVCAWCTKPTCICSTQEFLIIYADTSWVGLHAHFFVLCMIVFCFVSGGV